jgi:hypothetical protein
MARIFISYRRSLSRHAAMRLRDLLARHFGRSLIFLDDHSIETGADFPAKIQGALDGCEVFIPLIGPGWHDVGDGKGRRLDDPSDWVRREVETVLRRNANRPADSRSPVLIVPLLLDGASMPAPEQLPEALRRLASHNAAPFHSGNELAATIAVIEDWLGDPPTGNLGVRLLSTGPDRSRAQSYRFRAPVSRQELDPFVALSDEEPDIALSNPWLTGEVRRDLYERWCQWTASNPDLAWTAAGNGTRSFLTLECSQPDGSWRAIAVSIVLPLSRNGGATLVGTTLEASQDPARKRTAVTLEADDIAHNVSRCLLVDTWSVARADNRGPGVRRVNHHYWGVALVLRHLAEFWSPDDGQQITLMMEPNERVARVLSSLGFERRERNASSGDLFFMDLPMNPYRYSDEACLAVDRIIGNMRSIRGIEIVRTPVR